VQYFADESEQSQRVLEQYLKDLAGGKATPLEDLLEQVPPEDRDRFAKRYRDAEDLVELLLGSERQLRANSLLVTRYRLVEEIGAGSSSVVWSARDERIGGEVAIKFLHAAHLLEDAARERIQREARALSLMEHPHAVRIHDVIDQSGAIAIVMELCGEGSTLADQLAEAAPAANGGELRERVMKLIGPFHALASLHQLEMVHRDVKPSNLLLAGGVCKLSDLGLATHPNWATLTPHDAQVGTIPYSSPEQLQGQAATPASDVFSAGVTLYEALFCQHLFPGESSHDAQARILGDRRKVTREYRRAPRDLRAIIEKATSHSLRDRYPNAVEFVADLRAWCQGSPVRARPVSRASRARYWVKRRPWPFLAAAGLVLAVAGMYFGESRAQESKSRLLELLRVQGRELRALSSFDITKDPPGFIESLRELSFLLQREDDLPDGLRAELLESVAMFMIGVENDRDAAQALERAVELDGNRHREILLGWALRDFDLDRAEALLLPHAQLEESGQVDFLTLFARNRLATVWINSSDEPGKSEQRKLAADLLADIDRQLAELPGAEPWLHALNLLNLGTVMCSVGDRDLGRLREGYEVLERAEQAFLDAGLGGHPDMFFVHLAKSDASSHSADWGEMEREALAAAAHRTQLAGPNASAVLWTYSRAVIARAKQGNEEGAQQLVQRFISRYPVRVEDSFSRILQGACIIMHNEAGRALSEEQKKLLLEWGAEG
jgi:serine/threonine protein kinase